ncbi:hypothetical protein EC957_002885 [Mortierella hygrophila]|uniref:Phosphatidylserine decarboxylase n=1 Tax=Mortierella hygrophila TaxID=979708 RepID=A0A9P6F2W4_9FUNG|nr:hypothetical protein EC957_002885 [Mortierella hygrophila]
MSQPLATPQPQGTKPVGIEELDDIEQVAQGLNIQDLQSPSSPSSPTSGQQQQQWSYFAVREGLQGIKRIIGTRLAGGKEILVTRSRSTTSVTSVTIAAATDESEGVVADVRSTRREHVHFEEEEVLSDVEEVFSDADEDVDTDVDGEGVVSPPSSPQLSPTLEGGEERRKGKKKVYPGTINARFVKRQSAKQSMRGLEHALKASIAKTGPKQESARLFDGGILTSANQKKWYHTALPVNWIQKLSSEYHFGNYVITDRETGTKVWEDMPIYARIGMHLLFAGMFDRTVAKTHRIQHLFSVESVNQGRNFDAPESVAQIPHFIKTYKLDLSELLEPDLSKYSSFNRFFYRKLRPDARPIHQKANPNIIVSSADCRLCVFESIHAATKVWVKGKSFSLENLLRDPVLASQFEGGSIALFRLAPQDYHRFHSPVKGVVMEEAVKIGGGYVTVNPMAVNNVDVDVFTENVRKVTVIGLDPVVHEEGGASEGGGEGEDGGEVVEKCVFVSIGALLVGSIELTGAKSAGTRLEKGDELGYFAYGGSTCILLFQPGSVRFDEDLVATSLKGLETLVKMGEQIGERAGPVAPPS